MRNQLFKFSLLLILGLYTGIKSYACSSFAVYTPSGKVYYGMNFDYPDVDMRLSTLKNGKINYFHMEFFDRGSWLSTVGMNSYGLFSSCQMLFPQPETRTSPKGNETMPGNIYYQSLMNVSNTQGVINNLKESDIRLVHQPGTSLHTIVADIKGNAAVFEPGFQKPQITLPDSNFIVMTNFANSTWRNQHYTNVKGVGDDRYITAYEYIANNIENFDYHNGMDILEQISQQEGEFKTLISFLFDPQKQEVYVVINRNFNEVWKVNQKNGTIETFTGFNFYRKLNIGFPGQLTNELQNVEPATNNSFKVYSNAYRQEIVIRKGDMEEELKSYKLYNLSGSIIKSGKLAGSSISVAEIDRGLYILSLDSKNKKITQKVLIE